MIDPVALFFVLHLFFADGSDINYPLGVFDTMQECTDMGEYSFVMDKKVTEYTCTLTRET